MVNLMTAAGCACVRTMWGVSSTRSSLLSPGRSSQDRRPGVQPRTGRDGSPTRPPEADLCLQPPVDLEVSVYGLRRAKGHRLQERPDSKAREASSSASTPRVFSAKRPCPVPGARRRLARTSRGCPTSGRLAACRQRRAGGADPREGHQRHRPPGTPRRPTRRRSSASLPTSLGTSFRPLSRPGITSRPVEHDGGSTLRVPGCWRGARRAQPTRSCRASR